MSWGPTIFIGGTWHNAPEFFPVWNPATLEPVGTCSDCPPDLAQTAVDAASKALLDWSRRPAGERGRVLENLACLLECNAAELALLLVRESGKPRAEAAREVASSAASLRWNAEEGRRVYGRTIPSTRPDIRMWTVRQPVGVVVAIAPWNYPLNTLCRKIAPALAAGCTVIAKPAPETPLTTVRLAALAAEAGVPAGVLNVVTTSRAAEVVAGWIADARVRKIAFTGSTETGAELIRASAGNFQRLSLELGGSAPALVFDDANLEEAAASAVASRFRHAGQTCICVQRVYVQENIASEMLRLLEARVRSLRTGNGEGEDVDCGPLISEDAIERAEAHVKDALARGARLIVGGHRLNLPHPDAGFFFEPTLISGGSDDMSVMCDETFGPVLTVRTFADENEAIVRANNSRYGLAAYAFTHDSARVDRLIASVRCGTIGLNTTSIVAPQLPFGGTMASEFGKENGPEGLAEYLETKSVVLGGV